MPKRISLPDLNLESGDVLVAPTIAYNSWGSLNEAGDNTIVVCHSLTNHSDATVWWPGTIGPGLVLDTDRYFVICLNALGSPYGSTSPLSTNPDTGQAYGGDFPPITIRDTVQAHYLAVGQLGVSRIALAIGGSMGGMQVLEWGFHNQFVQSLLPIAVGGRHSPWGIAWTEAQRQAIYGDPNWCDGHYASENPPSSGLAAARMMAMISYRTAGEFHDRFGREASHSSSNAFSVESYLHHHGQKLVERFDANCYVQLTRQMNSHDVARNRGTYAEVLESLFQPTLVVGISSDLLYPLAEQEELAALLPRAELCVIDAPFGHDSFLVESARLSHLIAPFVATAARPRSEWSNEIQVTPLNPFPEKASVVLENVRSVNIESAPTYPNHEYLC